MLEFDITAKGISVKEISIPNLEVSLRRERIRMLINYVSFVRQRLVGGG